MARRPRACPRRARARRREVPVGPHRRTAGERARGQRKRRGRGGVAEARARAGAAARKGGFRVGEFGQHPKALAHDRGGLLASVRAPRAVRQEVPEGVPELKAAARAHLGDARGGLRERLHGVELLARALAEHLQHVVGRNAHAHGGGRPLRGDGRVGHVGKRAAEAGARRGSGGGGGGGKGGRAQQRAEGRHRRAHRAHGGEPTGPPSVGDGRERRGRRRDAEGGEEGRRLGGAAARERASRAPLRSGQSGQALQLPLAGARGVAAHARRSERGGRLFCSARRPFRGSAARRGRCRRVGEVQLKGGNGDIAASRGLKPKA
jgi:hypothetical protein